MSTEALDRLGVMLEQLEGIVAVGTQATFGELEEKEIRWFMYGIADLVTRCNTAYMEHQTRPRAAKQEATHEAH